MRMPVSISRFLALAALVAGALLLPTSNAWAQG
jgi:hypothetical protein